MKKGFGSYKEQQAAFARMSGKGCQAFNRDASVRAANTLPDTPSNRKEWANNTRRIDLEGVDTPTRKEELPKKQFIERFEKIKGVEKAIYIPNKLHLTIFYKKDTDEQNIKRMVLSELNKSNLNKSVESMSYYEEPGAKKPMYELQRYEPNPHGHKEALTKNRTYQPMRWKGIAQSQDPLKLSPSSNKKNTYRIVDLNTLEVV